MSRESIRLNATGDQVLAGMRSLVSSRVKTFKSEGFTSDQIADLVLADFGTQPARVLLPFDAEKHTSFLNKFWMVAGTNALQEIIHSVLDEEAE